MLYAKSSRTREEVERILGGGSERETEIEEEVPEEEYSMPEGLSADEQKYFEKLDAMTVHELRKVARGVEGFPIYGREISKANKKRLIDALMKTKFKK